MENNNKISKTDITPIIMDYEIRIYAYYTKLDTMLKLRDMTSDHLKEQDSPLNRLALQMAQHHVERCANSSSFL